MDNAEKNSGQTQLLQAVDSFSELCHIFYTDDLMCLIFLLYRRCFFLCGCAGATGVNGVVSSNFLSVFFPPQSSCKSDSN